MTRSTRPDRRALGIAGENTACLVVEEEGLRVIERNWRDGRRGEIDIIACDHTDPCDPRTVVVEVRTRVGRRHGSALASIDERKVTQLRKLTGAWCRARGPVGSRVRIDVVAITLDAAQLRLFPGHGCRDVDLRDLGARVAWLRGVQ